MKLGLALALVAAGCVGSVGKPPPDGASPGADLAMAAADLAAGVPDMATAGYPPGPYGNSVGDTFPPISWVGYYDPDSDAVATSKPYAPWSSDQQRLAGRRYALIHVSEFI